MPREVPAFRLTKAKSANLCQIWQNHATFCKLLQTLLSVPQTFGKCQQIYCKVLKALSSQNWLHLFSLAYNHCSKQSFSPFLSQLGSCSYFSNLVDTINCVGCLWLSLAQIFHVGVELQYRRSLSIS